jgi:C-terminal processing protease CtpA/Prc
VQGQREALVIDVRGNGGGSLTEQLLEKLCKKTVALSCPRFGKPYPFPCATRVFVLIVNARSASDSEVFAHAFRKSGLGKVVGTTTWGGVTGISQSTQMVDGSYLTHSSVAFYALGVDDDLPSFDDAAGAGAHASSAGSVASAGSGRTLGSFGLENYGFVPDIHVEVPPFSDSSDRQLEVAIQTALTALVTPNM